MNHVFSTITTPVSFVEYTKPEKNRYPSVVRKVIIKGGANRTLKSLETPRGTATEVSDEDLAFLVGDANFQKFAKAGFLTIASDRKDLESALKDMVAKDKSAPAVASDFKPGGKHAQGSFDGSGDVSVGAAAA